MTESSEDRVSLTLESAAGSNSRCVLSASAIRRILYALILFGTLARLYNIDVPLFDWHVYRQHDAAALARNFYEGGVDIFYPQADWRGASPG